MRLWRFLRRLRATVYVRGLGRERTLGLGYHMAHGTQDKWQKGGENGLCSIDLWIAHAYWDDPENDPRKGGEGAGFVGAWWPADAVASDEKQASHDG